MFQLPLNKEADRTLLYLPPYMSFLTLLRMESVENVFIYASW